MNGALINWHRNNGTYDNMGRGGKRPKRPHRTCEGFTVTGNRCGNRVSRWRHKCGRCKGDNAEQARQVRARIAEATEAARFAFVADPFADPDRPDTRP